MKSLSLTLAALLSLGAVSAFALTGQPPYPGFGLTDGVWLNGLAGGLNNLYIYGLTGAGTTQATAAQILSGYYLVEFDTVAASTGAYLPSCTPGVDMIVYNNGANTLTIYPNIASNPLTGAQDTINNTTTITVASHVPQAFSCAKPGVWFSK